MFLAQDGAEVVTTETTLGEAPLMQLIQALSQTQPVHGPSFSNVSKAHFPPQLSDP